MLKRWLRLGIVATSAVTACQFAQGNLVLDDGGVTGDVLPDAGACTSLATECIGDVLRVCTQVGEPAMDVACGWGCVASEPPHCAHLVPSGNGGDPNNGVRPSDVSADDLADIVLGDGITIDSDNGRIGTAASPNLHHGASTGIENGIDFQLRGPISMFRFKSLTLSGTVTIVGRRPTALVADGAIAINGILDARGLCSTNIGGPGGFNGGMSQGLPGQAPTGSMAGGSGAPAASSGGGGGGHGTAGGSGKNAAGGSAFGDLQITTLVGGAGGGAGSGGGNFGRGGGGGGAVQLISNLQVAIPAGAGINAGGCGGKPGIGGSDSGGGGGAGGTILIEAPKVTIAGTLAVNGGGGGGGGGGNAQPGTNGTLDRTPAPGGSGDGADEDGGSGAAGATAAGSGGTGANPGGGGGGGGRIRINTRNGAGTTLTDATLSPAPDDPSSTFSTGSAVAQ